MDVEPLAKPYVLVVDDEEDIRYSFTKSLERVGYQVDSAESGEAALIMMGSRTYDVVLTDIRLPGLSGVELLARIRDKAPDTVVILITGYASLDTAVEALRLGAFDYLVKPASSQSIRKSVARAVEHVNALRRRKELLESIQSNLEELAGAAVSGLEMPRSVGPVEGSLDDRSRISLGDLMIYPGRYQVAVGDAVADLTPTEFRLLMYLVANQGRAVSCHELVREVRGYVRPEQQAREIIRPHISNLRRKLRELGQVQDVIVNVRGIGYRAVPPQEREKSAQ